MANSTYLAMMLVMLMTHTSIVDAHDLKFLVHAGELRSEVNSLFKASREGSQLRVANALSGKVVWQVQSTASDHGDDVIMSIAPGMKRALILHQYGVRGQTLHWARLDSSLLQGAEIPRSPWRKAAADAAGILPENITECSIEIVRWTSPDECVLVWNMISGEVNEYHAGVVFINFSKGGEPAVQLGRQKMNMSLEEIQKLAQAKFQPLIESR